MKKIKPFDYAIYTDGSADNMRKPNYGGSAFVVINPFTGEMLNSYSEGFKGVTNNQMELHAIIEAVRSLPDNSKCVIFTDSQYCITVLNQKKGKYAKNMEYIEEFRYLVESKNIEYSFHWVKGHNGNKWNEYVDKLANDAFVKMGGELIDYKAFKSNDEYRAKETAKTAYLNACIEVAKDYIPVQHMDSFIEDLNNAFKKVK